jgi:hypothetical protein
VNEYARNPRYVVVVSSILGQGLILGNVTLLKYGLVWLLFHLFGSRLRRTDSTGGQALALSTKCSDDVVVGHNSIGVTPNDLLSDKARDTLGTAEVGPIPKWCELL